MTPMPGIPPDRSLMLYAKLIKDLGVPILVAVILLWVILKDVPGNAAAAARDASQVRLELAAHVAEGRNAVQRISRETNEQSIRLARIMQQICVNTATTAIERDRCFPN